MGPSIVKTFIAPGQGDTVQKGQGVPVALAKRIPLRVVVRVRGPIGDEPALVSYDPAAFNGGNTGATFEIPPLQSETFVVAPEQSLYVMSKGSGPTVVSVAISEAIGEIPSGANVSGSFVA